MLQTPADASYRICRYPTKWIESWTLAGGRRATLRPVLPQDDRLEQAFVAALSPASRRNRFHGAIIGLSDSRARAMTQIDYRRHMGFVVTVEDEAGDELVVADGRYVIDDGGESAEFALVVADAWRGLGLGTRLMHALCRCARAAGARWLFGEVLAENVAMVGLMERCGFMVRPHPADETLVRVERSVDAPMVGCAAIPGDDADSLFGSLGDRLARWIAPRAVRPTGAAWR